MNNNELINRLEEASAFIKSKLDMTPELTVVLGSGLNPLADLIENPVIIPYSEIPHFSTSTVEGHAGELHCGRLKGRATICMKGRVHLYEGYSFSEVTFPVKVFRKLGIKTLILTNAAGGINASYEAGDLMILEDHVNLMGGNPLIGENLDELGPRFPDMSETYSRRLRSLAEKTAVKHSISVRKGVYAALTGPSYETPAEIRMLRTLGADAIGMSTIPEAVAANHMGMEILAISCITNAAAGVSDKKLSHAEVTETAERVKHDFITLISGIVENLDMKEEDTAAQAKPATGKPEPGLADKIDHTLLKPDATQSQIEKICKEAVENGFKAVCINSANVPLAAKILEGHKPIPIAVVGFPLGAAMTSSKAFETKEAIKAGAREIDMVINIGALKAKDYRRVMQDIQAVVDAARPYPVKVIIETSSLSEDEKIVACVLSKAAGALFVKTSTGFAEGGATVEDIALMRRIVGDDIGVKASGGIKTAADAKAMIDAGATRIGASASVEIVKGS